MSAGDLRPLDRAERKGLLASAGARLVTTPVTAISGLATTAITIHATDVAAFGLITLVSAVSLMMPFSDLGVGAPLTTAIAEAESKGSSARDTYRAAVIRTSIVGLVISLVSIALGLGRGWEAAFGQPVSSTGGWYITAAVILFAASVPLGLGSRLLVGLGRNELSILISSMGSVTTLSVSVALASLGAHGLEFAVAGMGGLFVANLTMTVIGTSLARRRGVFAPTAAGRTVAPLRGSMWMLIVSISLPAGLQWGRIVVAQVASPSELAAYGMAAQFYGIAWGLVGAVGLGLWPVFVRRRDSYADSFRLWMRMTMISSAVGGVAGVALLIGGGWASQILSGGAIEADAGLLAAFALLIVAQSMHLTSGMLLTTPRELRWQAYCHITMAALSLTASILFADAVGPWVVPAAAGAAVFLALVVPDVLWVRVHLKRRQSL